MVNYHYICEDVVERNRRREETFLLDLKEYAPRYLEDNGDFATEDDIYRAMHGVNMCDTIGHLIQAISHFNQEFGGPDFTDPTVVANFVWEATSHRFGE